MTLYMRLPRRTSRAVALGILVLSLALASCGGRAARHDSGATGAITQQSGQSGRFAPDITSADQQFQATLQQLDAAQIDASTDLSAQDVPVEP